MKFPLRLLFKFAVEIFSKAFPVLFMILFLTACGGSGGGSGSGSGNSGGSGSTNQDFSLNYNAGSGGSITGVENQTVEEGGSGSQVTATPNTGYVFVHWSDGVTSSSRTDINVDSDLNVIAEFSIKVFTLSYYAAAGGSISGTSPQNVNYYSTGSSVTAIPDDGYLFSQWNDGISTATRFDSNVLNDISVTALFSKVNEFTLVYSAGIGGGLIGNTSQTVNQGGDGATVTAIADSGYTFVQWNDGVTSASRTDTRVSSNINVSAVFEIILLAPENVSATPGDGEIDLSWNSVSGATDYCVYVSETEGIDPNTFFSYDNGLSSCVGNSATNYSVQALTNSTIYFFVVTAKNGSVEGVASDEVSATPEIPSVGDKLVLNDTGKTVCSNYPYNEDGNYTFLVVNCSDVGVTQTSSGIDVNGAPVPSGQDALFGRDLYSELGMLYKLGEGHAGFDFTKLDASGNELPTSAAEWNCVRDNVTGLIWEVKSDDGGFQDKDNTYSWYNSNANMNGGWVGADSGGSCPNTGRCDTEKYVADVNTSGLCGTNNWRVPSTNELLNISLSNRTDPALDIDFFPNSNNFMYWSSRPDHYQEYAWAVYFDDGAVNSRMKTSTTQMGVRLVSGGATNITHTVFVCSSLYHYINSSTPIQDFKINGDGTVTHISTGLVWMQCSLGQYWDGVTCSGSPNSYDWQTALESAPVQNFAGYSDWRLPNKNELSSIVEQRCNNPSINGSAFPHTPAQEYWTSTSYSKFNGNNAWYVRFDMGVVEHKNTYTLSKVRLVRDATTSLDLIVSIVGRGEGVVSIAPSGIDCDSKCTMDVGRLQMVTLIATPSSGSHFLGWSGACSGNDYSCTVTMTQALEVTAEFDLVLIADRYHIYENGSTVLDVITGLEWQRCSVGQTWSGSTCLGTPNQMDWYAAKTQTAVGGFSLPTVDELRTLVYCSNTGYFDSNGDNSVCGSFGSYQNPTILEVVFPNTVSSWWWSSSSVAYDTNYAWGVNFIDGNVDSGNKGIGLRARLVRPSQ